MSRSLNRQIGLMLDRKGKVQMVIVGQAASLYIPELPPLSAGLRRLRGWRLLHTHLSAEGLNREDLLDMLFLRLDAMLVLTVDAEGQPASWQSAWLSRDRQITGSEPWQISPMLPWHRLSWNWPAEVQELERKLAAGHTDINGISADERAVLISVSTQNAAIQERNLDELEKLAKTAGLSVGGRLAQRLAAINPRFILGKGKLAELEIMALDANANVLVFDGELSPAQLHNLADITERKVLDRTQLILDIFAQHAVTRAGKLQVELAQLAYALPRLAGGGRALDRLMGGIGGRGPGESKLEMDRRKIRGRMGFLKRELENLRRQRSYARARRHRNGLPVVALVGYTNAGKSTLLNTLTRSDTLAANKLFATLDPAARRLRFPKEREIILVDTVGFIRNLPKELMEAFRAALEELESADLLVHVADASHEDLSQQIASVNQILEDLGLHETPRILALNKCDRLDSDGAAALEVAFPGAIAISASGNKGLDRLLARMENDIFIKNSTMHVPDPSNENYED